MQCYLGSVLQTESAVQMAVISAHLEVGGGARSNNVANGCVTILNLSGKAAVGVGKEHQ